MDSGTRRVVVVVQPAVNLLDLAGPVQVFDAANHCGAAYRLEYAAVADRVDSAQGLRLADLRPLPDASAGDLVLVPGPRLERTGVRVDPELVTWLRRSAAVGAEFAAVCSGAAALGEAGLLNGRRCTTHWELLEPMRSRYPRAKVQDGVLFTHDGPVSTSAGVASGIDLALSLVHRDHGPATTAAVARALVVYLRRPGGGAQLSPFLSHRAHVDEAVHAVQDHIAEHLDRPHRLADLAARVHLSPRGLSRAFTAATGITPLEFHQRLRLAMAEDLLTATDLTVSAVAARTGFRDARQLRRLYRERHGAPPSSLRA
ncbi:helix-turn-helix domain-containing protein [Actinokineospora sp. PR83]|uniref:GlxA family transcriptional regulator n=1 Tax=Actinokineospora sp. PR83 TaxID=2884908 RepID=UPI0027DEEA77|nr:helix-turn-helix domain-containing protein [Actinokineospora sp. PR83]MCG8918543.1 helix-turn-helix domain-containing protein [Actinokineospora sp. PR83]